MAPEKGAPAPAIPPFDAARLEEDHAAFDVAPFTPPRDEAADATPETGIDIADRPKIVFVAGRGKTGKTTLLRWAAEVAQGHGRPFLMADIDPTNASFSSYFKGVSRPSSDDPVVVGRWLQQFVEYAVGHKTSALIDLGGGDTVLRTIAAELPGFAEQIEAAGVAPVVFYLAGPQPEDLAPIATLAARRFNPAARAIVLNESLAEPGLTRSQAFGPVTRNRVFRDQMTAGAICLWMPRLHAASAVELKRAGFAEARDGKTTPPLGLFDRARVKLWLDAMARQFQGVRTWMP